MMSYLHDNVLGSLNFTEGLAVERVQLKPIEGVNGEGNTFRTHLPLVDNKGILQFSDSLLLVEDFEFPISYYGIRDAYVTLELQSYMTTSQRTTYTNEFIVDKIILIPKENEYIK